MQWLQATLPVFTESRCARETKGWVILLDELKDHAVWRANPTSRLLGIVGLCWAPAVCGTDWRECWKQSRVNAGSRAELMTPEQSSAPNWTLALYTQSGSCSRVYTFITYLLLKLAFEQENWPYIIDMFNLTFDPQTTLNSLQPLPWSELFLNYMNGYIWNLPSQYYTVMGSYYNDLSQPH